jgi:hypothetical protein
MPDLYKIFDALSDRSSMYNIFKTVANRDKNGDGIENKIIRGVNVDPKLYYP